MQGIVGIRGVCESVQPEFDSLAKEDWDHLGAEAHNADGGPLVRGAVRPAQLATFHVVAAQARGGPADQTLPEFSGGPVAPGKTMASVPPIRLSTATSTMGIGEKPKEIIAGGVILPELTFGGGHHGPIKGGNTGIGIGPEGG